MLLSVIDRYSEDLQTGTSDENKRLVSLSHKEDICIPLPMTQRMSWRKWPKACKSQRSGGRGGCGILTPGHDKAVALLDSQQLWLCEHALCRIESVTLVCRGAGCMTFYPSQNICPRLMLDRGGRDIFSSGVVTGKVAVFL